MAELLKNLQESVNPSPKNMENIKSDVARLTPEVEEHAREDFFSRMDEAYFSEYSPDGIAEHLRMAEKLTPESPVQAAIKPAGKETWEIAIVAYDYFSVFSILCGLMASFGLDIHSGNVFTFSRARSMAPRPQWGRRPSRSGAFKRKIVDIFRVGLLPGWKFGPKVQSEFNKEMTRLLTLLDQGKVQDAREAVNRRLISSLSGETAPLRGLEYPVDIRFDNAASELWTIMEIHSKDTPAFLYAFSNALAMRGIYIHKVEIKNAGDEAHDRLYVSNSLEQKIQSKADQDQLRIAAATIKQFTPFLASAPDPAKAIRYFDQFLDKFLEKRKTGRPASFLSHKKSLELLARLLGTSDFLWEDFLRIQFDHLLPVLKESGKKKGPSGKKGFLSALRLEVRGTRKPEEEKIRLNAFKDREMFRIDMEHLKEKRQDLSRFSRALSDLSEAVLEEALRIALRRVSRLYGSPKMKNGKPCSVAVFGLGKFGGREMGYASDIELQFVFGGDGLTSGRNPIETTSFFEKVVQEILALIDARQEGIFHIDLRLRPDGNKGLLAGSLARFVSYYSPEGEAAPFERQALTKLRHVAGDPKLGRQVETHRNRFVYSGESWDLPAALHLRDRQIRELVPAGKLNVKYSPGGVVDVEYTAQYLQIMNGNRFADLRNPSTLETLKHLGKRKLLSPREEETLREGYLFLRILIDALRMVRGNARDLVLPERSSEEFKFLARRIGYGMEDWEKGANRLEARIKEHMGGINRFFDRKFRKS